MSLVHKAAVYGTGHLAETLCVELNLLQWSSCAIANREALAFVAHDVTDHGDSTQLLGVEMYFREAQAHHDHVVVLSQVPPGWTRDVISRHPGTFSNVYYQVDTIIVDRAVERMLRPEQFIIGCADPQEPLPLVYQAYLAMHRCPVRKMSYESAELTKCAINYLLAAQIRAANAVDAAARACGADYAAIEPALRADRRVGQEAYIRPGELNQHLSRDASTVERLAWRRV